MSQQSTTKPHWGVWDLYKFCDKICFSLVWGKESMVEFRESFVILVNLVALTSSNLKVTIILVFFPEFYRTRAIFFWTILKIVLKIMTLLIMLCTNPVNTYILLDVHPSSLNNGHTIESNGKVHIVKFLPHSRIKGDANSFRANFINSLSISLACLLLVFWTAFKLKLTMPA